MFGENLAKLRKEKGMSQEDLANELNVSRQAVYKWESNSTFPETEKIVAICKLFNCSMDELMGLKEGSNSSEGRKTNKIINAFNHFVEECLQGLKLFYNMTFKQKFKCLLEMFGYAIILIIVLLILDNFLIEIIRRLLSVLPIDILWSILQIFEGIFMLLFFVFGIYFLVKMYKIRYLDYYNDFLKDKDNIKESNNIEDKKEKIIIRDPNKDFKFFNMLKNILILFLKIIAISFVLSLSTSFVMFLGIAIFLLYFVSYGTIIVGIIIALAGILLIFYILEEILIKYIFSVKQKYKHLFIIFVVALVLCSVGGAIFTKEFLNYKIVENDKETKLVYTDTIPMSDNIIIYDYYHTEIIFEDRDDIYIEFYSDYNCTIDKIVDNEVVYNYYNNQNEVYELHDYIVYENWDLKDIMDDILEGLKNKEIVVNGYYNVFRKIYISESNYQKIEQNNYLLHMNN